MTLRRLVQLLFGALIVLATMAATFIVTAAVRRGRLVEMQKARFASYQLADMLRQSSDDLTRFARTYVSTGDPKFEQYYRDVLAIRQGEKPRPDHYERIYWDLLIDSGKPPRADGPPVSLRTLMQEAGFTAAELDLLKDAETNSNELVRIEEQAIHAVKGEFADAAGGFTRRAAPDRQLAERLMNDAVYHHEKARIMTPIDRFLSTVETRTAKDLDDFNAQTAVAFWLIEGVLAVFVGLVVMAYPIMRRRVLVPVAVLQGQTRAVAEDLERLAGVATDIAAGNLSQSFSVSARPIGASRTDEVSELTRDHDSMIGQLQRTGSAIASITTELKASEGNLRVAKQTAEAATAAKSGFLASMSHEIRTPMNAILGYSQLLLTETTFNDQQRRKLQVIRSSGEHLLGLINDILEMSRIEAGRVSLSNQPFDLWNLLDDVQAMFEQQAASKHITLVVDRDPLLVRTVRADPGKVRQVAINLVGNALKFIDHGRVVLRAASTPTGPQHCAVRIAVEDTGPGIPPEDQARIFEAFRQAEGGVRRGGTGLGLAISSNFAHLMGGGLSVASTPGVGSTFTFTFAARIEADAPRSSLVAGRRRLSGDERRRKAIAVDDVETNLELMMEELTQAGFDVRGAGSGEDALAANEAWPADVIVMDLQMSGMGGVEAIRRLRRAGSAAAIVAYTASVDESAEAGVLESGADAFVRKPAPEGELLNTIARVMGVTLVSVDPAAPKTATPVIGKPADALKRVPAALLQQLAQAARQARVSHILKTADAIADHDPAAAECVRHLAQDFRYDDLISAINEVNAHAT